MDMGLRKSITDFKQRIRLPKTSREPTAEKDAPKSGSEDTVARNDGTDPGNPEGQATDTTSLEHLSGIQGASVSVPGVDSDRMEESERFRVLIVGRANAGKKTILRKVCNSTASPDIYDEQGRKVRAVIDNFKGHGPRDINHQIIFKSGSKFVFHYPPSFEPGREDEFLSVKNFIEENGKSSPEKQIHAIWYCIPMDQFHHVIPVADRRFFNECDTRNAPVVAIYTKCDALVTQAFQPKDLKLSLEDQLHRQRKRAQEIFGKDFLWRELKDMKFPPKRTVQLENMDKPGTGCEELLNQTATALNDESLHKLLTNARTIQG